jgi:hypothetical protein
MRGARDRGVNPGFIPSVPKHVELYMLWTTAIQALLIKVFEL